MTKIFTSCIFLLLFSINVSAQETWGQVNKYHAGHQVIDFGSVPDFSWYYMDGSNAVLKGIYVSRDDGKTWTRKLMPASPNGPFEPFKEIFYFDSLNAIVKFYSMGDKRNVFYSTDDGGTTFTKLSDQVFADYVNTGLVAPSPCETSDMTMLNKNFGYCYTWAKGKVSNELEYLITTTKDGGKTWNDVSKLYNGKGAELFGLQFINENIGFASADPNTAGFNRALFKTKDGGVTWDTLFSYSHWIRGFYFVDENIGYVALSGATGFNELRKTIDGGKTWTVLFDNSKKFPIRHMAFTDGLKLITDMQFTGEDHGIIAGRSLKDATLVIRTDDGGLTWHTDSVSTVVDKNDGYGNVTKLHKFGTSGAWAIYNGVLIGEGEAGGGTSSVFEAFQTKKLFKIYPNPAKGKMHILNTGEKAEAGIYSASGGLISLHTIQAGENTLDLQLPQGVYFIRSGGWSETLVIH